jgi:hypothetical protein
MRQQVSWPLVRCAQKPREVPRTFVKVPVGGASSRENPRLARRRNRRCHPIAKSWELSSSSVSGGLLCRAACAPLLRERTRRRPSKDSYLGARSVLLFGGAGRCWCEFTMESAQPLTPRWAGWRIRSSPRTHGAWRARRRRARNSGSQRTAPDRAREHAEAARVPGTICRAVCRSL